MMPDDKVQELTFPIQGINVTSEYQEQPPGTSASCSNVRGFDFDGRQRGGSRPGLSKYIPQQIPEGAQLIQHLNMIVDPTVEAQPQNYETIGSDWIEDPRNPGFWFPPTGWGYPQGTEQTVSPTLAFRQSFVTGSNVISGEQTYNFTSTVGTGTILFVFVATLDSDVNTTVTVKNGALHNYTQVGSYKRFTKIGSELTLSLWYRISADGSGSEGVVKVTPSSDCTICVGGLEFGGQNASPLGNDLGVTSNAAHQQTGNIVVATASEAVIACFAGCLSPDTGTPDSGFTLTIDHGDGTIDNSDIQFFVVYKTGVPIGTINPGITLAGGADDFAAIGLCIKD